MPRFIKRKIEVEDPGYTESYTPGEGRVPDFRLQEANLFFIGLRGSGKSTLARKVARRMKGVFVDTDEVISARINCSISEYVLTHGWGDFRLVERDCLLEVCKRTGQVVATGGGIVLVPENIALLKKSGKVFYLQAEVGLLASRLKHDPDQSSRPPLSSLPLEEELGVSLREREPLYHQCLDSILQAGKTADELVEDVLNTLRPAQADFSRL